MYKLLFLIFLASCGPSRLLKKDHNTLSESPCVDGVILNIEQAGCEGIYWGLNQDGDILKIRCTYAPKGSMWTKSSFYAVKHGYNVGYSNWFLFCEDRHVKVFNAPYKIRLD